MAFIVGLAIADRPVGIQTPAGEIVLDVPYLSQSEALCGGAAVAMVLRYWGDLHASVRQFATLVDRRTGGIHSDALVRAVEGQGWQAHAVRLEGQVTSAATPSRPSPPRLAGALGAELARGRPVIVLIEDRPRRYHYVVVVGIAGDGDLVIVHDPSRGPRRRVPIEEFGRRWQAGGFWSTVILPPARVAVGRPPPSVGAVQPSRGNDECAAALTRAVEQVRERGLAEADAVLGGVRSRCPDAAGPLRELAGVRFAEHRWAEAARLAEQAAARDPDDAYAREVLASSRFIQDDFPGALTVWNQLGKPRIDTVQIDGVLRTTYASVVEALRLPAGSLLTGDGFRRAQRLLDQLPDVAGGRISYRPPIDNLTTVDVSIAEMAARPRGAMEWAVTAAQAAIDREAKIALPDLAGQGELWTASWRWWSRRPRAAFSLAAPHAGLLPGVWQLDASWEEQTYAQGRPLLSRVRERRTHAGLSVTDWLTANLRYSLSIGLDDWTGFDDSTATGRQTLEPGRRSPSVGGRLEDRFLADRVSIEGDATAFRGFRAGAVRARFQSRPPDQPPAARTVLLSAAGLEAASERAPFALWPGAGDGRARPPLLRGHPLLHDGIIAGPMFGRQLAYAMGEVQRWLDRPALVRLAIAGFVDAAGVRHVVTGSPSVPTQVDIGAGIRVKAPGQRGLLRVDFGRGVRDGAYAVTVGWQY